VRVCAAKARSELQQRGIVGGLGAVGAFLLSFIEIEPAHPS
jgi:hypothetical protein